jgi:hypothetical protein
MSEATSPPARDKRQRHLDHAEMLAGHKATKQRRRELHSKRKYIRSITAQTLV